METRRDLLADLCQRIEEMATLKEDWDGADALPVSERTIRIAKDLITEIYQETRHRNLLWASPDVFATPQGGIYLHWDGELLKYSVQVAPETGAPILLVDTGEGRANRYSGNAVIQGDAGSIVPP